MEVIFVKRTFCFIVAFTFFFVFSLNAKALVNLEYAPENIVSESRINSISLAADRCDSIFGDPDDHTSVAYWLQWVLDVIKYVAIAALLVLSTMDFIKALVSNDKDAVKKAGTTTAKRFIYCVLIFFLPIIVDFLMTLFGAYGTCGLG